MKRRVFLGLAAAGVLAGCGGFRESRINPRNWFGRSRSRRREAAAAADPDVNPLIPEQEEGGLIDAIRRSNREAPYTGTLVAEISALDVEQATGGAIIRVRGLTAPQGVHDVRLVPDDSDGEPVGGVLGYELRAVHGPVTAATAPRPREVQAAVFVSDKTLQSVREIRVRGLQNERVSRR
ncbi:hypothetical protein [Roseovarius ramblicola]|uniref:Lipoprotein n=1 Tax=Roseovarius ramblicola TaxID=2022336 RepID=A0ABV5I3E2_9RHOB